MKRRLALTAACAFAVCAASAADSLASRISASDGWVSWDVPMIAGAGEPCCWSGRGDQAEGRIGCDLDGRNHGFSTSDSPKPPGSGTLTVYAHVTHARMDDVRAYEASCPVRAASAIRHVDGVAPGDSIAVLARGTVAHRADTPAFRRDPATAHRLLGVST